MKDPKDKIPTIFEDLDINDEPFTLKDFTSLKLGKAAGPDNIHPEVFKLCVFDEMISYQTKVSSSGAYSPCGGDKLDLWSFMNIFSPVYTQS